MTIQNPLAVREKIINFLRIRGPSLPVHISRETGLSILFASAFLSELYSEKEVNISNLRVGSSPLYFIPGHEAKLENFSQYLKNKEKEAFILLKENKFLKDSELHPAIRVALKEIKDFAVPFTKEGEIYWRFFTTSLEEFQEEKKKEIIEEIPKIIENLNEKEIIEETKEERTESSEVEEQEIKKKKTERHKYKTKTKNQNKKKDENFFNKIKEFLSGKGIEILDIKNFKNEEAVLKIQKDDKEELLFIFNKKKITEKEILKAGKIALESKMEYSILFLGEVSKKLSELINAVKNLTDIGKIE